MDYFASPGVGAKVVSTLAKVKIHAEKSRILANPATTDIRLDMLQDREK